MQQADDPAYLSVGTEVSAKYKGAFCEAKVRKVVRNIKCKVAYKQGLGSGTVSDDQIKGGILRVGATVEAKHPDRRDFIEATITKIQDCSQYTVVFDDGDITTLRRSALCLKSGRHFNESETLDQLPLTHPEHFGNPVIGGRRGRRSRHAMQDESSEDEDEPVGTRQIIHEKEEHIGKVVCVESTDTKKKGPKENWFPALVVAPTAQDTVRIRVKDEYLVRSFKDGRYYTVPKKEATEFTRVQAQKQDGAATQAALEYLDNDTLPAHWDRDALFGLSASSSDYEQEFDSDSSDDEPREEKDHFVAQLYKYMDDRGTPLNKGPSIANKDVDLYRLFRAVQKLGCYNRVTTQNQWKAIAIRLGYAPATASITNLVKQAYKKFLQPFEEFNRKLGCTMVAHPRANRIKGRSLVRANSVASPKPIDNKDAKSASSTATEEYENTSESSSEPTKTKRKLSTNSGSKVKTLVEKFEEKNKEDEEEVKIQKIKVKEEKITIKKEEDPPAVAPIAKPNKIISNVIIKEEPQVKVVETPQVSPVQVVKKEKLLKPKGEEKRGRKKKEVEPEKIEKVEKVEKKDTEIPVDEFPVDVGDKLKVYYHEQKVTYEAKVIEITLQHGTPIYLVHYTGWNTRYDEWVPKDRIAENLTNKQKRTKSGIIKSTSGFSSSVNTIPNLTPMNKSSSKRGRGSSRSDSQPPRSTTPSSITSNSSRTKSPATPAQRRTTRGQPNALRRTSNNTDISSLQTESDTDSDEPVKKPNRTISNASNSSLTATHKSNISPNSGSDITPTGNSISTRNSLKDNQSGPTTGDDFGGAKGRDYDLNQIRSELKGFKEMKSPSPETDRSPTSSTHHDHKTSLFELSDSNTDSNEQKTLSDLPKSKLISETSSESDSLAEEDDSQSSIKIPPKLEKVSVKVEKSVAEVGKITSGKRQNVIEAANIKKEAIKEEKIEKIEKTVKDTDKGLSKILGTDKASFKAFGVEKPICKPSLLDKEIVKPMEDKVSAKISLESNPGKTVKGTIFDKGSKMDKLTTNKNDKKATPEKILSKGNLSGKTITDKLNKSANISSLDKGPSTLSNPTSTVKDSSKKEKDVTPDADIYEFKEPEPFEFEAAATAGRKLPPTSANISPENEKKGKKTTRPSEELDNKTTVNNPQVNTPSTVKRTKKAVAKAETEKPLKQIKKEEPVEIFSPRAQSPEPSTSTSTKPLLSSDPFDVLRKSPNFNMANTFGSETLPEFTQKILTGNAYFADEKFQKSQTVDNNTNKSAVKPAAFVNTFTSIEAGKSTDPHVSLVDIKDVFKGPEDEKVKEEPVKELETVKKILLSSESVLDLEPPKIEKPSIVDKLLKTFNQQHNKQEGMKEKSESPQPPTISPILGSPPPLAISTTSQSGNSVTVLSSLSKSPENINLVPVKTEPPKIEVPVAIKKQELEAALLKKPVLSSPEHKLDILESIAPKNNDLSETIQKLESVIQKSSNIDRFTEDSSDSTDSEQRLVIEDESQSSETTTLTQTEFISINKKDTDLSYVAKKDINKADKIAIPKSEDPPLKEESVTFETKFQTSIFGLKTNNEKLQVLEDTSCIQTSLIGKIISSNVDFIPTKPSPLSTFDADAKPDLICKESFDDLLPKRENELPSNTTTENTHNNESISLLLCEETIPCSPVASGTIREIPENFKRKYIDVSSFANPHPTTADIKPVPMDIETGEGSNVKMDKNEVTTPNSSPRDSISPDDSKSDSEDLKKQGQDEKKRRRARKSSECDTSLTKRRKGNSRRNGNGNGSDSEDNSDPSAVHRTHLRRSPKPCQYNFLIQLDPALNSNQRISILKKKIQELRKTYNSIKAELASIDRRRKKLRRRERENKKNQQKVNST